MRLGNIWMRIKLRGRRNTLCVLAAIMMRKDEKMGKRKLFMRGLTMSTTLTRVES